MYFIAGGKGGVATVKGVGEKGKECTLECKSQPRLDEMAPWALNHGSGVGEEVMRKGGGGGGGGGGGLYS